MRRTVLLASILGFALVQPVAAFQPDLERVEAMLRTERANIEAGSPFIPDYLLDELERLTSAELGRMAERLDVDGDILREALEKVDSMERFRQELASKNLLLDSGCFRAGGGGFEGALLADPENPQLTFNQVLGKAHGIFIATVTEVRNGYYKGLGTRVLAEIEEVLGTSPLTVRPQDAIEYFQGYFDIKVRNVSLCAERPGFLREQPGDRILLLAAPTTYYRQPDKLVVALTFPIVNGKVVMQPYRYLLTEDPIYLDTVRSFLTSEDGRVE